MKMKAKNNDQLKNALHKLDRNTGIYLSIDERRLLKEYISMINSQMYIESDKVHQIKRYVETLAEDKKVSPNQRDISKRAILKDVMKFIIIIDE